MITTTQHTENGFVYYDERLNEKVVLGNSNVSASSIIASNAQKCQEAIDNVKKKKLAIVNNTKLSAEGKQEKLEELYDDVVTEKAAGKFTIDAGMEKQLRSDLAEAQEKIDLALRSTGEEGKRSELDLALRAHEIRLFSINKQSPSERTMFYVKGTPEIQVALEDSPFPLVDQDVIQRAREQRKLIMAGEAVDQVNTITNLFEVLDSHDKTFSVALMSAIGFTSDAIERYMRQKELKKMRAKYGK